MAGEYPRTLRTKEAINHGFIAAMVEYGYDAVRVQHILKISKVSRSTFYAHFKDKEDVVRFSVGNLCRAIDLGHKNAIESGNASRGDLGFVYCYFMHVANSKGIYRAIMGNAGEEVIARYMHKNMTDLAREDFRVAYPNADPLDLEIAARSVGMTIRSLLGWWIESEIELTAAELFAKFQRQMLGGAQATLSGG